jgi:hypothetical protein
MLAAFVGYGLRNAEGAACGIGNASTNGVVGGLVGAVVPQSCGPGGGGGGGGYSWASDFFEVTIAAAPIATPALMTVRRCTLAEIFSGACPPSVRVPFPRVVPDMLSILPNFRLRI